MSQSRQGAKNEGIMNYEELRGVGKIWILMGVFSACFFVSCGQSQNNPPETVTPVTHTKPVSHDIEPRPVSLDSENDTGEIYSEDHEGSGYSESDFDDMERNEPTESEYTEDIPPPQQPAEDPDSPTHEVSSNTDASPNPEVALNATSGSPSDQDNDSPAESPETPGPAEDQNDEDETSPLLAAQTDDDTDADDFSVEIDDDADRG